MKSVLTPEEQIESLVLRDVIRCGFPKHEFEKKELLRYIWDNVLCRPGWPLTKEKVEEIVARKLNELEP